MIPKFWPDDEIGIGYDRSWIFLRTTLWKLVFKMGMVIWSDLKFGPIDLVQIFWVLIWIFEFWVGFDSWPIQSDPKLKKKLWKIMTF